jgi:hypothetical protein
VIAFSLLAVVILLPLGNHVERRETDETSE